MPRSGSKRQRSASASARGVSQKRARTSSKKQQTPAKKSPAAKSSGAKTSGKKSPAARSTGSKSPGARAAGKKQSAAKHSGKKPSGHKCPGQKTPPRKPAPKPGAKKATPSRKPAAKKAVAAAAAAAADSDGEEEEEDGADAGGGTDRSEGSDSGAAPRPKTPSRAGSDISTLTPPSDGSYSEGEARLWRAMKAAQKQAGAGAAAAAAAAAAAPADSDGGHEEGEDTTDEDRESGDEDESSESAPPPRERPARRRPPTPVPSEEDSDASAESSAPKKRPARRRRPSPEVSSDSDSDSSALTSDSIDSLCVGGGDGDEDAEEEDLEDDSDSEAMSIDRPTRRGRGPRKPTAAAKRPAPGAAAAAKAPPAKPKPTWKWRRLARLSGDHAALNQWRVQSRLQGLLCSGVRGVALLNSLVKWDQGCDAEQPASRAVTGLLGPLVTMVLTGRLDITLDLEAPTDKVALVFWGSQAFFDNPGFPFEASVPLQHLMSFVIPENRLPEVAIKAKPRWWTSGHVSSHDAYTAGDFIDEYKEMERPVRPCRHCHLPKFMHDFRVTSDMDKPLKETRNEVWDHLFNRKHFGHKERKWLVTGQGSEVRFNLCDIEASACLQSAKPELIPQNYAKPIPGLTVQLRDYQAHAVDWMLERERNPSKALHPSVEVEFAPDGFQPRSFHYNDATSELSLDGPCGVHGGVLASDMGMGKTVMTVALLVKAGSRARVRPGRDGKPHQPRSYIPGGTLIIVPPILVSQWIRHLRRLAPELSVYSYYGCRTKRPARVAAYDVVVTSYGTCTSPAEWKGAEWPWGAMQTLQGKKVYKGRNVNLNELRRKAAPDFNWYTDRVFWSNDTWASKIEECRTEGRWPEAQQLACEFVRRREVDQLWAQLPDVPARRLTSPLKCIKWHRLVCDEAHLLGGALSSQIAEFVATNRWMLTGTPCGWTYPGILEGCFGTDMHRLLVESPTRAAQTRFIASVTMRHEKTDCYPDGTELLQLPPKRELVIPVVLDTEERWVYDYALRKLKERLKPFMRRSTWFQFINDAGRRLRRLAGHMGNVSGNPFDVQFPDWRAEMEQGGAGGWAARPEIQQLRQRLEFVTLTGLRDILQSSGCGRELVASIVRRDYQSMPDECPICMEVMHLGTSQHPCSTFCGHIFCGACICGHIDNKKECPGCRAKLQEHQIFGIKPEGAEDVQEEPARAPSAAAGAAGAAGAAARDGRPSSEQEHLELFNALCARPLSSKLRKVVEEFEAVRKDEEAAKFLIFTQFECTQRRLEDWFAARGVRYVRLGAGMSLAAKRDAIEKFQREPEVTVFLLTIQVGAVGLNLTEANQIFIVDPPNNLTLEKQAIGRCWRMGQGNEVTVRKFITRGTIEDALLAAAQRHTKYTSEVTIAPPGRNAEEAHDGGRGVALLARRELIQCFGFTEADVYDRERDG
eukprot:TRINITY_DN16992_c1_g1_i1.p1 TRINITY_DN16992_c1_g1~~TRINITY_DN16992_c1_g1_i1.p1  ORF type:complete len:1427 (+),score=409.05 TRINITY_DN16992_c1_g1_i1:95-4375(+)